MAIRVPLNLYLLRSDATAASAVPSIGTSLNSPEDVTSPEDASSASDADGSARAWIQTWILDDDVVAGPLPQTRDSAPALLVRSTPTTSPWLSLLISVAPTLTVDEEQQNLGALLFQVIGADVVAWSFGHAWNLLDPSQTVDRFGLRAGLNALLTSPPPRSTAKARRVGVRELTSAVRAAVVRRSTVQAARPSSPTSMERIDQASDAAAMAQLTTHHPIFDRIGAGRSLRFDATVSGLADLEAYAKEALRLFRRNDYTKSPDYQWIDYTVPVSDPAEVDRILDELYAQATRSKSALEVDVVWADADPESGVIPAFVCFPREQATPSSAHRTDLTWAVAATWLAGKQPKAPGHEALRTRLRFYADDCSPNGEVELWQLLVAQLGIGKDTYMVSDGEVSRASRSHIHDIDNLLAPHVVVNPAHLPAYKAGEREGNYNQRASVHGKHFLLDKSLVQISGQTTFEPCDLLSHDGRLMHVKRKTSSSTMSHVAAQALTSTQMLRNVPEARDLLDAALISAMPAPPKLASMRDHCASFAARPTGTVEIVIVGSWRGTPDITQLPLLTRITLNGWIRQMPCPTRLVLVAT